MVNVNTYNNLMVTCFAINYPRGVGYYYTVTQLGMAHTAFRTRAGLLRWMELRRLTAKEEIPEPLPIGSSPVSITIIGEYKEAMHMRRSVLNSLAGIESRKLSNAEYTKCVITTDDAGVRTVHYLNPNVRDRIVYDYNESRTLEDEGLL